MTDRERRIRELAYSIWLQEACPEGQAERHWAMAKRAIETFELAEVAVTMNADRAPSEEKPPLNASLNASFEQANPPDAPTRSAEHNRASRPSMRRTKKSRPEK